MSTLLCLWRIRAHRLGMRKKQASRTEKREPATPKVGQEVADSNKQRPHQCNGCRKIQKQGQLFWQCECCKLVEYCGTKCQKAHWPQHKRLCNSIKEQKTSEKVDMRTGTYVSYLTPKQRERIISLVGRRCTITGKLNGEGVEVLWNTGAQVSIVSASFIRELFPGTN